MFTGIIEELGRVASIDTKGQQRRLTVKRRCWPLVSIEATRPSSSMIPVNIEAGFKVSSFRVSRSVQVLTSRESDSVVAVLPCDLRNLETLKFFQSKYGSLKYPSTPKSSPKR